MIVVPSKRGLLSHHFLQAADVSVIIPAHRDGWMLRRCLESVAHFYPLPGEVIVAVDGGDEGVISIVKEFGFMVLPLETTPGVSAARNAGARMAKGSVLAFLDSDVVAERDFILSVITVMSRHPHAVAAFGSYDKSPAGTGIISRYRNLLHHFTHQNGSCEASTFWAGCGACTAAAFWNVGGFDEKYRLPCVEDIDLGYRLRAAGFRIVLEPSWQVCHLKNWRLADLLTTDLMRRAIPWTLLMLQNGKMDRDLNVDHRSRLSALLCILIVAGLAAGFFDTRAFAASLLSLGAVVFLNRRFYILLMQEGGWGFASASVPLHLFYFLVAASGFAAGWLVMLGRRLRVFLRLV